MRESHVQRDGLPPLIKCVARGLAVGSAAVMLPAGAMAASFSPLIWVPVAPGSGSTATEMNAVCQTWDGFYGPVSINWMQFPRANCQGRQYGDPAQNARYSVPMNAQCRDSIPNSVMTPAGCFSRTESTPDPVASPAPSSSPPPGPCGGDSSTPASITTSPTAGNPVLLSTGDKLEQAIDYSSGDSGPFKVERFYSLRIGSAVSGTSSLGLNWTSVLDRTLFDGGSVVNVQLEGGRSYDFNTSNGTITPAGVGRGDSLVHNPDGTWLWTASNGEKTNFSSNGRLISMVQIGGLTTSFSYSSVGVLQSMADNRGRSASFTWSSPTPSPLGYHLTAINVLNGPSISYSYTSVTSSGAITDFVLSSVTTTYGTQSETTQYLYEDTVLPTALTGVIDPRGIRTATWTYDDSSGMVVTSDHAGGVDHTAIAFNDAAQTRTVTNALGKQTTYQFTTVGSRWLLSSVAGVASSHCPASTRSITYSSAGFVQARTDEEGRQYSYLRDAAGRETSRTEAVGASAERTITRTLNPTFPWLPSRVVEAGLITDYTYDANGNVLTKVQTDTTTVTAPYATNGRTRSGTYTWAPSGQLLSVDGPLAGAGDTVTYAYNPTTSRLSSVTNELGQATQITSWDYHGLPTTIVDANGVTSTLTYDLRGRPLTATVSPGSSQSQYQFAYDAAGNATKVTLPGGGYLQYAYDGASRLTSITNSRGQLVTIGSDLNRDVTSRVITASAGGATTSQQTYAYDELGRLLQSIGAAGATQTTSYVYDKVDNRRQVTDARSKVWGTTFDALNRVVAETDPESHSVQYAYAANDQLTTHIDGNALQTTRVIDGFGQTIQETSPDRGVRTYWYDAAGRMTKLTDGDAEETDFAYDNAGRLKSKTFPGASWETQTYTYDSIAGGNKGVGRLTSLTDQPGSSAFVYDAQGRLTNDTRSIEGQTYAVAYAYDANSRVSQITLPSGRIVTYTRANDGLVSGITTKLNASATAATVASGVTYKPFGPLASLTYGNGLALTNSYDLNYWLTRTQAFATGANRLDLSYTRNGVGALTDVTDNASSGRGAHYGYFDSGRLNWATGPWGEWDYAYDSAGNMVERDKVVGGVKTYNLHGRAGGTNRIVQVASETGAVKRTLTYRDSGDLYQDQQVGGDLMTYAYNAAKRPVLIQRNSWNQGNYGFNAFGQRVWRQVFNVFGATTANVQYLYDPDGHLLAEHDGGTGAVQKEYIWLDDQLVAMVDSTASPAKTLFVHAGQIGEPLVMTDSTKAKVWDGYVDPYGIAQTFSSATANIDLRFPGQWQQTETGPLYQNGIREYDPTLGRYAQADPIGLEAGQNVYAYANGMPTMMIDPDGLDATIAYYDSATGHIGIGINSPQTYGFYPKQQRPIAPGEERPDGRAPTSSFIIKTTPAQDAAMVAFIRARQNSPGQWKLIGRSCSDMVTDTLRAGGLNQVPRWWTPSDEYVALRNKFGPRQSRAWWAK